IARLRSEISRSENMQEAELHTLEQKLMRDLAKRKISDATKLREEIQHTERQIQRYEKQERTEEAKKEKEYLNELKELTALSDRLESLKRDVSITDVSEESTSIEPIQELSNNTFSVTTIAEKKNLEDLDILHQDWTNMPSCAEKS